MDPAIILKIWLVAIPLPKRAYRSVENGVTIAPEMSATMYDQTGSVVSPWSTLIRPTYHPEEARQACTMEATEIFSQVLTGEERNDQQYYVPPPRSLFIFLHGDPMRIGLRLFACVFEGRDNMRSPEENAMGD
jgi:hypothetical protein